MPRRLLAALVHAPAAASLLILAGCAGPSRKQYVNLLHECRTQNREHLRMLKAYEKLTCDGHPEQSAGAVEMGLGGF